SSFWTASCAACKPCMRGAVLARQSMPGPSCGIFGAICQERSGRDNPRSKLPERTFETFLGCKCSTSSPWERGTEHKIRNYVQKRCGHTQLHALTFRRVKGLHGSGTRAAYLVSRG